jgi:hypothetical protein
MGRAAPRGREEGSDESRHASTRATTSDAAPGEHRSAELGNRVDVDVNTAVNDASRRHATARATHRPPGRAADRTSTPSPSREKKEHGTVRIKSSPGVAARIYFSSWSNRGRRVGREAPSSLHRLPHFPVRERARSSPRASSPRRRARMQQARDPDARGTAEADLGGAESVSETVGKVFAGYQCGTLTVRFRARSRRPALAARSARHPPAPTRAPLAGTGISRTSRPRGPLPLPRRVPAFQTRRSVAC